MGILDGKRILVAGVTMDTSIGFATAKVAQEQSVQAGPLPFTIVRSTQFFEFVPAIADAATVVDTVHATPGRLQLIASTDVVAHLAEVVAGPARNAVVEIAGPEPLGLDALVRRLFADTGDARSVVTDPQATYFGAEIHDQLIPAPGADAWLAPTTYDAWLISREPTGAGASR